MERKPCACSATLFNAGSATAANGTAALAFATGCTDGSQAPTGPAVRPVTDIVGNNVDASLDAVELAVSSSVLTPPASGFDLDAGLGFEAMGLHVLTAEPLTERQAALSTQGDGPASDGLATLIDRLEAIIETGEVSRAVTSTPAGNVAAPALPA